MHEFHVRDAFIVTMSHLGTRWTIWMMLSHFALQNDYRVPRLYVLTCLVCAGLPGHLQAIHL